MDNFFDDLFAEEECLFCGDLPCTCPVAEEVDWRETWTMFPNPGAPAIAKKIRNKENVWVVVITADIAKKTCVVFDKNSGRRELSIHELTPLGKYKL